MVQECQESGAKNVIARKHLVSEAPNKVHVDYIKSFQPSILISIIHANIIAHLRLHPNSVQEKKKDPPVKLASYNFDFITKGDTANLS